MGCNKHQRHWKAENKRKEKAKEKLKQVIAEVEKLSAASAAQSSDSDSSHDNTKTAIAADQDHEKVIYDLAVKQNYYKPQNFEEKVAKQEDDAIYGEESEEAKSEEKDMTFYRIFRKGNDEW